MQRATQSFNLTQYLLQEIHEPNFDWQKPALQFYAHPDQPPRSISYASLRSVVKQLAAQLQQQVSNPGARVLIALPHSMDYALCFLSIIAAGLVAVPASPQLTNDELQYLQEDSKAGLVIDLDWLQDRMQSHALSHETRQAAGQESIFEYASTNLNDPAFLVYTSGTSGRPRGVLHAQRAILGRIPMRAGWTGLEQSDRLLHAGQLNWTYSMGVGVLDTLAAGATGLFFQGQSTPQIWPELWQAARVSIFAAVPSLYRRILKYNRLSDFNLESLRYGLTAGEALTPGLLESWRKASGLELYEALGMSEISTYISSGPHTPVRVGSPGKAQPGRRVCVLPEESDCATPMSLPAGEPGLLAIAKDDPGLMLGYWNGTTARAERPAFHFRDDWFVGGDRVTMDADGYITYLGRADDVMNLQGYRVAPLEVEQVLLHSDLVHDVGIRAVEVKAGVNIIVAFIIKEEHSQNDAQTRAAIRDYASRHLADYKRPREIVFVDSLPRTASGKLRRNQLPTSIG